jgi:hypothetical protein
MFAAWYITDNFSYPKSSHSSYSIWDLYKSQTVGSEPSAAHILKMISLKMGWTV